MVSATGEKRKTVTNTSLLTSTSGISVRYSEEDNDSGYKFLLKFSGGTSRNIEIKGKELIL